MPIVWRLQTALIGLVLLTVGVLLLMLTAPTPSSTLYVQDCFGFASIRMDSHNLSLTAQRTNATTTVSSVDGSTTEEQLVPGKFGGNVPKHVAVAISKLYRELKANGSIINDLLSTDYPIIPNIYHYVRFNQSNMRFHEMLSIQSALKIGEAEKVYIHANVPPEGKYWDMIKDDDRIQLLSREPPTSIFGKPFGWVQHSSDLARIQILREYGGIYLDNDCLVIHEFRRLRKHHCVVSKSSEEKHMGNMVMMATPDCVFMQLYEELYKLDYRKDMWYYNGGELPSMAVLDPYPGIALMADEGVQQRMLAVLWMEDRTVEYMQKYWNIIHLFYGHKSYTAGDTTEYNEENINTIHNTFTRLARWILSEDNMS